MPAYQIPAVEITLKASRAGGPGGQHVNTSSTRIEAVWNVLESPSLSEARRHRLLRKLGTRIDSRGNLRVVAGARRSQAQNKAGAIARLRALVQQALAVPKARVPTRPTRGAIERRIEAKKRRGARKRERQAPED